MSHYFTHEFGDHFRVLDLKAAFWFKTPGSISFNLGTMGDTLYPVDSKPIDVGPNGVFNICGWMDIHYPCSDHIRVRLRVKLPERYLDSDQQQKLIAQTFAALGLSSAETFEATFIVPHLEEMLVQSYDQHGFTDRV